MAAPPPPPSKLAPPPPPISRSKSPIAKKEGASGPVSIQQAIKSRAAPKKKEFNEEFAGKPTYPTNLMACGNGKYGRLAQGIGNGNFIIQFMFCKSVEEKLKFVNISAGAGHALALTANGSVYSWGKCHFGQLGHGEENEDVHLPKRIDSLEGKKITGVGCGWSFSTATGEKGNLYAWGCGFYGALGTGNEQSVYIPTIVPFFSEEEVSKDPTKQVSLVKGGSFHTAVITKSKKLYVFGRNSAGQLGLGNTLHRSTPTELSLPPSPPSSTSPSPSPSSPSSSPSSPSLHVVEVACGDDHTGIITADGKVWITGKGVLVPHHVAELKTKATMIDVGIQSTLVLDEHGIIYEQKEVGSSFQRLSVPSDKKKELVVKYIGCGETHSMCITKDGKMYTWGDNYCGKLGHRGSLVPAHVTSVTTPVSMVDGGSNHIYALLL